MMIVLSGVTGVAIGLVVGFGVGVRVGMWFRQGGGL